MAKFMVLYNSTMSASEVMANSTPEQVKASMDEWTKWAEEARKKVKFEFGMPLEAVSRITAEGEVKSDSQVGGYSMMEGDKNEILELLKTHPQLKRAGASIDLLEFMSMPGLEAS